MRTEIQLTNALGRTLEGFEFSATSSQAVLIFTDDTFATLDIDRGYDRGEETITEGSLDLHTFGNQQLIGVGILTQKEIDERSRQEREIFDNAREERERAEYERLKHRFETD